MEIYFEFCLHQAHSHKNILVHKQCLKAFTNIFIGYFVIIREKGITTIVVITLKFYTSASAKLAVNDF